MAYGMASLLRVRGHLPCNPASLNTLLKASQRPATESWLGAHVWWSRPCRWYQVRVQESGARGGTAVPSLASVCVCREQLRCASTKAVEGESVEPVHRPLFQRFWRWLHDIDDLERWDNPPDSKTQAELDEREAFLSRVQAMYFADPPQKPDLQFCRESLEMLMKYNDRVAVETLWNILPELNVEPDDELTTRVLLYLKKARLEAYYE